MAKKKAKTRLFDLDAMEVSLVPKGKNLKKFLIAKEQGAQEENNMNKILEKLLSGDVEDLKKFEGMLPETIAKEEDKMGAATAALKLLQGIKKEMPKEFVQIVKSLVDVSEVEIAKELTEDEMKEALTGKGFVISKEGEPVVESISKEEVESIKESIKKEYAPIIEGLTESNKDLAKKLGVESNLRIAKEFEEKASDMGYLGEKKESIAKMLMGAKSTMSEDDYKTLEENTKASADALKDVVSKELGTTGDTDSKKAGEKLEAIAKEFQKEDKTDYYTAFDKALSENPELYAQYEAESK